MLIIYIGNVNDTDYVLLLVLLKYLGIRHVVKKKKNTNLLKPLFSDRIVSKSS